MKEPKAPLEVIDGPWGYATREADAVFIPAVRATPEYPLRRVLAEVFERTGETRMIFSAILNPDDLRPRLRNIVREWDEYVEYMDDYSHCIEIRYEVPLSADARDLEAMKLLLSTFIRQWQRDAWASVTPKPLTPGQAIGAAGARAADLAIFRKPTQKGRTV